MGKLDFDTEFASVQFWVTGVEAIARGRGPCPASESIHRIDWCVVDALCFTVDAGFEFEIGVEITNKPGWSSWEEGGEFFSCTLCEHQDGHQACIGLRDYEWLEERFGLCVVQAAKLPDSHRAKFKATQRANIEVEISLALTKSPATEFEAVSPWLLTDRAMKF